jgi:hypothetical protein
MMMTHDAMMLSLKSNISGIGFKILLDLFASAPKPLEFKELPYQFRKRHAGESKLDTTVAWEYLLLLLDKLIGQVAGSSCCFLVDRLYRNIRSFCSVGYCLPYYEHVLHCWPNDRDYGSHDKQLLVK